MFLHLRPCYAEDDTWASSSFVLCMHTHFCDMKATHCLVAVLGLLPFVLCARLRYYALYGMSCIVHNTMPAIASLTVSGPGLLGSRAVPREECTVYEHTFVLCLVQEPVPRGSFFLRHWCPSHDSGSVFVVTTAQGTMMKITSSDLLGKLPFNFLGCSRVDEYLVTN